MEIILDINKSVEENAGHYFEQAKKARKKMQGVKTTIDLFKKKREEQLKKDILEENETTIKKIIHKEKFWFEKFKWFITSEGFLVVAARDATTNEILIKKHVQENDIILHTDMAGSPFVVIKKNQEETKNILKKSPVTTTIGKESLSQAATFTFIHSKAWKAGIATEKVFYVKPNQVTKTAESGEYLTKGAFMIRGEKTYVEPELDIGAGLVTETKENQPIIIIGPQKAIESYSQEIITLQQGNQKANDIATTIQKTFQKNYQISFPTQYITHLLPTGCQIPKRRLRKHELKK
jgi:predicted ribosome quality control (RQC) complex YloA/Tae2 family protein